MTIRVNEKSKAKLAFVTLFVTFQFRRMPFGARDAGNTYSRFVDDIICHTPKLKEYIDYI